MSGRVEVRECPERSEHRGDDGGPGGASEFGAAGRGSLRSGQGEARGEGGGQTPESQRCGAATGYSEEVTRRRQRGTPPLPESEVLLWNEIRCRLQVETNINGYSTAAQRLAVRRRSPARVSPPARPPCSPVRVPDAAPSAPLGPLSPPIFPARLPPWPLQPPSVALEHTASHGGGIRLGQGSGI